MTEQNQLLPCPFCGDENPKLTHDDYVHDDLRPMPVVECAKCHTWVRAEAWNKRAAAPTVKAEQVQAGAEWIDPVALSSCGPVYDAGWRDGVAEAKRLNEKADMADAYVGAREDLSIWKRRALEAEQKVRHQEQIIDHLTLEAQGETRFGEPSLPAAGSPGEEVEVVGWLQTDATRQAPVWLSRHRQVSERAIEEGALAEPVMTVAQHERIDGQRLAEIAQLRAQVTVLDLKLRATPGGASYKALAAERDQLQAALSAQQSAPVTKELAALAWQRAYAEGDDAGDMSLRVARHVAALLGSQQSAPERVSVPVELLERVTTWREGDEGDSGRSELRALLASHGRGEA